jgi:hypothetical protein
MWCAGGESTMRRRRAPPGSNWRPGPARPVAEARSGETRGDKGSSGINRSGRSLKSEHTARSGRRTRFGYFLPGPKDSRGCCHRLNTFAARGVLASRPPGLWPDERLHDLQVDSHHPGRRHDRCLRDFPVDRHHPGSHPDSRHPSHPNDDRSWGFPLGRDRANGYRHNSHHPRHRLRRPRRRSRHRLDNRCSHMPDQRSRAPTRPHRYRKRSPEAVPPQGSPRPPTVCVDDTFRSLPPPFAVFANCSWSKIKACSL